MPNSQPRGGGDSVFVAGVVYVERGCRIRCSCAGFLRDLFAERHVVVESVARQRIAKLAQAVLRGCRCRSVRPALGLVVRLGSLRLVGLAAQAGEIGFEFLERIHVSPKRIAPEQAPTNDVLERFVGMIEIGMLFEVGG